MGVKFDISIEVLDKFLSTDRKSIILPVALGEVVYKVIVGCGNFCLEQHEKHQGLSAADFFKIKCVNSGLCRIVKPKFIMSTLRWENLEEVLEGWGTSYFETIDEAFVASQDILEFNRCEMIKLGFEFDEKGNAIKSEKSVEILSEACTSC